MTFLHILILMLLAEGPSVGGMQQQDFTADAFPPFGGRAIHFIAPTEGQKVAAGDSLDVYIEIDDGLQLETAMVVFPGGGLTLEPPFRDKLAIAKDKIGYMSLMAMGRTTTGEVVSSKNVTIEIEVRGAELTAITTSNDNPHLSGPRSIRSMSIYGEYSDGIRRNITEYLTVYSIVEGADVACVTDDGVIVGRASGAASVLVKHGTIETTIPVSVGNQEWENNEPQAVLEYAYEGVVGKKLCFSAAKSRDFDACVGEPLGEDSYQWKLEFETSKFEGDGTEFCFTPAETGLAMLTLTVTDVHGGSSWTMAMVVID